jgi:hypothetical protein
VFATSTARGDREGAVADGRARGEGGGGGRTLQYAPRACVQQEEQQQASKAGCLSVDEILLLSEVCLNGAAAVVLMLMLMLMLAGWLELLRMDAWTGRCDAAMRAMRACDGRAAARGLGWRLSE